MGKLRAAPAVLAPLRGAVPWLTDDAAAYSRGRDAAAAWRQWYKTAKWQALRWQVLVDAAFTCAMCGTVAESKLMVADHIRPHRGNAELFWARPNLQCLCRQCHDTTKQRQERGGGIKTRTSPTP